MRVLIIFDDLNIKHKLESEIVNLGFKDFLSIQDLSDYKKCLELFKPSVIVFSLENSDLQQFNKLSKDVPIGIAKMYVSNMLSTKHLENGDKIISTIEAIREIDDLHKNRAYFKLDSRKDFLIKINEKYKRIRLKDIVYLEADGKYVNLVLLDRVYNIRSSLKSLIPLLPEFFIRVHASFIINSKEIDAIHTQEQNIESHKFNIPFSRRYKSTLLELFHIG